MRRPMRAAATPGRRSSRHAVRRVVDLRPPGVIYYAEDDASDGSRLFGRLEGQAQRAASSDGTPTTTNTTNSARMRAVLAHQMHE